MSEKGQTRVTVAAGLRRRPVVEEPAKHLEIPRLARLLALAHRWDRMLTEGTVASQAEIARRAGLSRARVSQINTLRYMPLACQEQALAPQHATDANVVSQDGCTTT